MPANTPNSPDVAIAYHTCLHNAVNRSPTAHTGNSPSIAAIMLAADVTAEVLGWVLQQPASGRWRQTSAMYTYLTNAYLNDQEARA